MVELPKIKTLEVNLSNDPHHNVYVAEFEDEFMNGTATIKAKKTNDYYGTENDKIKESSEKFVNGYKVVRLESGLYSYVSESDNQLVPFKYDFATNFNEHGMAMVAKGGYVTWINKDFYLSVSDLFNVYEDLSDISFTGWHRITEFSEGDNPLSLMQFINVKKYGKYVINKSRSVFLRPNGKAFAFTNHSDESDRRYSFTVAYPFNENGLATARDEKYFGEREDFILQSNGLFFNEEEFYDLQEQQEEDKGHSYQKVA